MTDPIEAALATARIIWVLGPPGAGKTTWATEAVARHPGLRRVDLSAWAAPLQLPAGPRPGMRRAKGHLMDALRVLAHADGAPERFVVPVVDVEEAALFPGRACEVIIALLPEIERVRVRLEARPARAAPSGGWEQAAAEWSRVAAWGEKWSVLMIDDVQRPERVGLPTE